MASRAQQVGMNGSITLKNNRMPMINGLKINTNDSIEVGLNEFKLNVLISFTVIFVLISNLAMLPTPKKATSM